MWTGTVPSDVGALSLLATLSLGTNALSGSLPPQLATLASLQSLTVADNQLTGALPPLADLTQLSQLELSGERCLAITHQPPPRLASERACNPPAVECETLALVVRAHCRHKVR